MNWKDRLEKINSQPLAGQENIQKPLISDPPKPSKVSPPEPEGKRCYCCKSTDFWTGGTEKYPKLICRKCHPPAPGAERI